MPLYNPPFALGRSYVVGIEANPRFQTKKFENECRNQSVLIAHGVMGPQSPTYGITMKNHWTLVLALAASLTTIGTSPFAAPQSAPQKDGQQFAILFLEPVKGFTARSGPDAKSYWQRWSTYIESVRASGQMTGGSALQCPTTGKVLGDERGVGAHRIRVSGYLVVTADSLADATKLAEASPAVTDGGAVEVRPLLPMQDHKGGN